MVMPRNRLSIPGSWRRPSFRSCPTSRCSQDFHVNMIGRRATQPDSQLEPLEPAIPPTYTRHWCDRELLNCLFIGCGDPYNETDVFEEMHLTGCCSILYLDILPQRLEAAEEWWLWPYFWLASMDDGWTEEHVEQGFLAVHNLHGLLQHRTNRIRETCIGGSLGWESGGGEARVNGPIMSPPDIVSRELSELQEDFGLELYWDECLD